MSAGHPTSPRPELPLDRRFDSLDPVIDDLLRRLPEFGPSYLDLVEGFDDDPGSPVVFTELAGLSAHAGVMSPDP